MPGQALVVPAKRPDYEAVGPVIEVNAYAYQPPEEAVPMIGWFGTRLSAVILFAYQVTPEGSLQAMDDVRTIGAAYAQNTVPVMSIINFSESSGGGATAHTVFTVPAARDRLLMQIAEVIRRKGYLGLNIDFENVRPDDRTAYNAFLQRVVDTLHPLGCLVSTALMPKTADDQPRADDVAYDYEAHGRIADFVVLMTYEWGYRSGPPQAISPITEMRRVVTYARSVMPAAKISLGFETYARDWLIPHRTGQLAETYSPQEAVLRAARYGADIGYDEEAQAPFFRYTDEEGREHEVWFEDARSAEAKFDLVKAFQLRGISYWVLGYPFPQNWALLESHFTIGRWH